MTPAADVPLGPRTTLGVGGPARFFLEVTRADEVAAALAWAAARGLGVEVLGGGSNVLVADRGLDALVLSLRAARLAGAAPRAGITQIDDALVDVDAGVRWDDFVAWAVARDLAGVECLSGIPGDVGAAPIQNVGAYGQEVAETLVQVETVVRASGEPTTLAHADLELRYRDSIFKHRADGCHVLTRVRFRLRPGGAPRLAYAELQTAMAHEPPTLAATRAAVIALRRAKSMVLDPADDNRRSAGSFFMNPSVDGAALEDVRARAARLAPGARMPEHPSSEPGRVKLSAAWLIERAGLAKGTVRGNVGISSRHSLALINRGGATAAELLAFAIDVRRQVHAAFGVALHPEPRLLGFTPAETAALTGQL